MFGIKDIFLKEDSYPKDWKNWLVDLLTHDNPPFTSIWTTGGFTVRGEAHDGQVYVAVFDVVLDDSTVTEPGLLFILTEHLHIIKADHQR